MARSRCKALLGLIQQSFGSFETSILPRGSRFTIPSSVSISSRVLSASGMALQNTLVLPKSSEVMSSSSSNQCIYESNLLFEDPGFAQSVDYLHSKLQISIEACAEMLSKVALNAFQPTGQV